jgi:putative DNA primase/helicase
MSVTQRQQRGAALALESNARAVELAPHIEITVNLKDLDMLGYHSNDYGNAQRIIAAYGQFIRYSHAFKKWLLWTGRQWRIDDTEQVRRCALLVMLEFVSQAVLCSREDKDAQYLLAFAKASLNSGFISGALRTAQSELPIRPSELDRDPYLLNFLNGTVDLRTSELRPHNPADFVTKLVHYDYRPSAQCPLFRAFLLEVMGEDIQMVKYLQRALGYSLTGSTGEKAVFVLFGAGNNGKTTLLSTIRELISEYAVLMQVDTLMTRSLESNNAAADLADLRGARFVMTSESESGQQLAQGKLKRITQGMGRIKATRKYENPVEFTETHKLWMDTNRKPLIGDGDDGATFARLHPIPFDVQIPRSKINRDLPQQLLGEAEGILSWCVAGAKKWYTSGLLKPPQVEAANKKWRAESDKLGQFISERCAIGEHLTTLGGTLYSAYRAWAESNGERPLSGREFATKLQERPGISKRHTEHGATYSGIKLVAGKQQSLRQGA